MSKRPAIRPAALLRNNPFLIGLGLAVALALAFPGMGASDGPLKAGLLSRAGVMVVFLLQGLSLRTGDLGRGLRELRLHGYVQAWIFLLSPIVLVFGALAMRLAGQAGIADGFLFLALLPTTITSAVIFTSSAGGNTSAAIFNTSLSNIIGVFWVPVGSVLLFSSGAAPDGELVLQLLGKLSRLILLPFVLGQLLRPFLHRRAWFGRASARFKVVNNTVILFIVFTAFSDSMLSEAWTDISAGVLAGLVLTTLACVLAIHAGVWAGGGWLLRRRTDRICALFCGSQKTLAAGAPMALAIFSGETTAVAGDAGLILLPLLCYHPLQLVLAGLLLPRLRE